jgi:hypothetical protein
MVKITITVLVNNIHLYNEVSLRYNLSDKTKHREETHP